MSANILCKNSLFLELVKEADDSSITGAYAPFTPVRDSTQQSLLVCAAQHSFSFFVTGSKALYHMVSFLKC